MKIVECTRQYAGETADVLDRLMNEAGNADIEFSPGEWQRLIDLAESLRDAERGPPSGVL